MLTKIGGPLYYLVLRALSSAAGLLLNTAPLLPDYSLAVHWSGVLSSSLFGCCRHPSGHSTPGCSCWPGYAVTPPASQGSVVGREHWQLALAAVPHCSVELGSRATLRPVQPGAAVVWPVLFLLGFLKGMAICL